MNTEDFYKETKPYLWNSDLPQKDEGFYGKDDMERFAEEYHQAKLKLLGIGDVVISEAELCDNPNCEDGIVDYDYYKNPIYCQVCDKHN